LDAGLALGVEECLELGELFVHRPHLLLQPLPLSFVDRRLGRVYKQKSNIIKIKFKMLSLVDKIK
jgi:hypothetical protein